MDLEVRMYRLAVRRDVIWEVFNVVKCGKPNDRPILPEIIAISN